MTEQFRAQKRFFWLVYFFCITSILIMPFVILLNTASWQDALLELKSAKASDWLLFTFTILCFHMLFSLFYWFLCKTHTECMVHYSKMSLWEQQTVNDTYRHNVWWGKPCLLENCLIFVDLRRLFMRSIISYDDIIWIYAGCLYYSLKDFVPITTVTLMTKDGKKHSVFINNISSWEELKQKLPCDTILGYGKTQKQSVKEICRYYTEHDASILERKKTEHRKNLCALFGVICLFAAWGGAYIFVESDYYDYLQKLRKADSYYAAEDYYWAQHLYKRALELRPKSTRARDGYFLSFVEIARECSQDGMAETALDCWQIILEWQPKRQDLYMEAADAALNFHEPITAVTFLDMGISASIEAPDVLWEKRDYILAHIRIESCTEYFDGIKHKAEFYDQSGNKIETVYYTGRGRVTYVYDENGNCVEESHYNSDSKTISFTTKSVYNKNGNNNHIIEKYSNGNIYRITEFSYDADGNEIECICRDENGTLLYEYKNFYSKDIDSGETIQEQIFYNGQNQLEYSSKRWFDANKNCTKFIGYDYDGTILQWAQTEYDDNNHRIRHEEWYGDTCTYNFEYTYDEAGLLQTVTDYNYYFNNTPADNETVKIPFLREEYFYDAAGNCVREVYHYDSDISSVKEFEYEYVFEE